MVDGMDDNDPMRHTVRKMKRTAEQAVTEGLRLAQEIADATRQMRLDTKVSNVKLRGSPASGRVPLECWVGGLELSSFQEERDD